ncbi:MAG: hypothetical protein A2504_09945 [Bdellovibrionales bacterium RIFOXYD12_FULL_39_22]|nr:MAG: hypothetical protein A2385_17580 [Bdellovibrionales bacterium RIFOXYB1_FULL_39_21]OFZ43932.1 MAG: hypothetical protein A2485_04250 [Bdellovibrionales bacterium RIFOXYC12_FULL_39_17]OFZ48304.1 MAG: hypothetical protein A2404_01665 [Bdellovibrionales bacterium RIFOXYC1_FULL_39_130]OFZ69521.1 MAG: hypothetical protein A2451_03985 [Bdellovibrionales bacterium RIFOXYC2_FULL_39_8]OFZ94895.1 MAG: hypothetical protein A2504_09945 [Bdellovibrionales bacterium RIFOXYD12_FULL_39_22]HLE12684.1 hyp
MKQKKSEQKMIDLGTELILEMLRKIPLTKGVVGKKIGLSKGGFWYVTHKSGKMNKKNWEALKKLYLETNKDLPEVSTEEKDDVLQSASLKSLVDEIKRRGWTVTLTSD